MEKNYYDILEVNKNASPEIIEKAYKTLVKKYHPDLQDNNLKAEYEEKIKLINEAFEVLSDSEKRKNYDLNLKQTEFSVEDYNNLINENLKLKNEINYLKNTLINYKNNINNNLNNKINENYNNIN
ncbi:MAG: DnaJ domain-containing protein, partial [Clostridia bacterium]